MLTLSLKEDKLIEGYKIIVNKDRGKTGIPKGEDVFDEIYLYHENDCTELDSSISLAPQINDIGKNIPWLYVYFAPDKECSDINELASKIFNRMAQELAGELKTSFERLIKERN